jgi:hypothetical protein
MFCVDNENLIDLMIFEQAFCGLVMGSGVWVTLNELHRGGCYSYTDSADNGSEHAPVTHPGHLLYMMVYLALLFMCITTVRWVENLRHDFDFLYNCCTVTVLCVCNAALFTTNVTLGIIMTCSTLIVVACAYLQRWISGGTP